MWQIRRMQQISGLGVPFAMALLVFSTANPTLAGAAPEAVFSDADLALLENRFFSHPYAHDPVEKRLERLECMVFGGLKSGSNGARLEQLKKVIAQRSATPLAKAAPPELPAPSVGAGNSGGKPAPAQYPVLNTLEWRVLKKTYANEGLEQRLDRLESKMFGQPAQLMSYFDRVERLKKVMGIDSKLEQPKILTGQGPKPRAGGGSAFPQALGMPSIEEALIPPNPFGIGDSPFNTDVNRRFAQIFQEMNRQMDEAMRLGPGSWRFDQKSGSWIEAESGREVKPSPAKPLPQTQNQPQNPGTVPRFSAPQRSPYRHSPFGRRMGGADSAIPPYADPNSI